ncbi:hypothetical protein Rs2_03269 [Raphanus sativus]|nr:hypothetical protein Rs2_03269 [Raphanus sativus]
MPFRLSHPQTSRSTPPRQFRPPSSPSLPHLVLGHGNLYPCECGVPLFSKVLVPISCYLIRTSPSLTSPTRSSSTNSGADGLLRDSEEIHRPGHSTAVSLAEWGQNKLCNGFRPDDIPRCGLDINVTIYGDYFSRFRQCRKLCIDASELCCGFAVFLS